MKMIIIYQYWFTTCNKGTTVMYDVNIRENWMHHMWKPFVLLLQHACKSKTIFK